MEESYPSAFDESTVDVAQAVDVIWLFFCLVLVTLMQPGFASYEVGTISGTSWTRPILLKNMGDASVSFIAWFMSGYAFASGTDFGGALGTSYFFFTGEPFKETEDLSTAMAFLRCLYQWSFAAACTTIVSGAVADRIPFRAYLIYAFLTAAFFYPLLAHWVWAAEGWASSSNSDPLFGCGVIDFAGSGVVHMCGGGIGLFIAMRVEARKARFFDPDEHDWPRGGRTKLKNHTNRPQLREAAYSANDLSWMTLGCFLLWIGWYGFNAGSTLQISTVESQRTAGRAALNTTIAAAFGCIFSMMIELVYHQCTPKYRHEDPIEDPLHRVDTNWDAGAVVRDNLTQDSDLIRRLRLKDATLDKIKDHRQEHDQQHWWFSHRDLTWSFSTHKNLHGAAVNGILAGLVGITAGCATMGYGSAIGVSFMSALLYHVSYRRIICMKIDDSVGAGAIHFVCGAWGLIAAGFTATDEARLDAGYPAEDTCTWESQLGANALMTGIISIYAFTCTQFIWCILKLHADLLKQAEEGRRHVRPEDRELADLKQQVIDLDLGNDREAERRQERMDQLASCVQQLTDRLYRIHPESANATANPTRTNETV